MKKRNMSRITALLLAVAMLLSLAACGGSGSQPDSGSSSGSGGAGSGASGGSAAPADAIEWSLGTTDSDPETSSMNSFADFTKAFCDLVNERAEGRLVITPYYNSVLGGDVQLLNDVRDGNLEICHINPMSGIDPRFGFKALPYLFEDFEQVRELMANPDGELFQIIKDICAEQNTYCLSVGEGIMRGFLNSKHPVRTVADLKDLTCRVYEDPCVSAFWSPICNASILSWSECYTSLQTGTVDGMESAATISCSSKFYEVTDYYTDIDWQWVGEFLILNQDCWDELDPDLQEIVQQAAWEAAEVESEKAAEYREQAYAMLEDNGVEVTLLSEAEKAEWVKYGRSCYEPIREIVGAETYDRVIGILEESNSARNAG